MDDEAWADVYWVRNGKNRKQVLTLLAEARRPFTATELADHDQIDISMNSAAITLRELADRGLVTCINPDANRYRAYRITDEGKTVVEKLDEPVPC